MPSASRSAVSGSRPRLMQEAQHDLVPAAAFLCQRAALLRQKDRPILRAGDQTLARQTVQRLGRRSAPSRQAVRQCRPGAPRHDRGSVRRSVRHSPRPIRCAALRARPETPRRAGLRGGHRSRKVSELQDRRCVISSVSHGMD